MRGGQYARIWYCARKGGKGGGVAFVVLNPVLSIPEVGRLSRGGLAIRVSSVYFDPFVVTNAYFPPAGSHYREDADYL